MAQETKTASELDQLSAAQVADQNSASVSAENITVLTATNEEKKAQQEEEINQHNNILEVLFSNNNKLLTMEDGEINIDGETRRMLALFSDGTYLVDEAHRFDGKVLNFTSISKRRTRIWSMAFV